MTALTIVAVYADGGVIGRNPSPDGGTWAWCHVDADNQRVASQSGIVTPASAGMGLITNNLTEMIAVVQGLRALPVNWSGFVYSDSKITLGRLFWDYQWNNIPEWLRQDADTARRRLLWDACRPILLDGHPTKAQLAVNIGKRGNPVSEHNIWCDAECGAKAKAFSMAEVEV